jgi:hypothetical protein
MRKVGEEEKKNYRRDAENTEVAEKDFIYLLSDASL